jgi:hypothetical protein
VSSPLANRQLKSCSGICTTHRHPWKSAAIGLRGASDETLVDAHVLSLVVSALFAAYVTVNMANVNVCPSASHGKHA